MKHLKLALSCCLLLALIVLALSGAWFLFSWRQTPEQHRNLTYASYNAALATWNLAQASAHVEAAVAPLADPQTGLSPSMKALVASVQNTTQKVNTGASILFDEGGILEKASTLVDTLNTQATDIGQAAVAPLKSANTALESAQGTLAQVNDALPLFLDCEFNSDCAFNRFQGTSKAIEQMARAGGAAAPKVVNSFVDMAASGQAIAKSGESVAGNVAREVDEATRPKRWYQKLLGPAYTIGRLVAAFL